MGRKDIYTVYDKPESFEVVKMDHDFEHIETYHVSKVPGANVCTCFAGNKDTCRHRQMVEIFREAGKLDSREAYNYDKHKWVTRPKAAMEMIA